MDEGDKQLHKPPPMTGPVPPTRMRSNVVVDRCGDEEPLDGRPNDRKRKIIICAKKTCKVMSSHLGLFVIVIVYATSGGFLFQHLEKPNEKSACFIIYYKYRDLENITTNHFYEIATQGLGEEDTKASMSLLLEKFRDNVYALDWDVNCTQIGEIGGVPYKWSLTGSILFAVTVISTIGKNSLTMGLLIFL
ncbi:uncharacterized protein LOC141905520 [Tubulanus polymorphus]|uniref:uncharacterized protein LOC141905520 n=1 Tax=Tubulanus polymorphus TaxID=672921 RepID=UPI003DA3F35A